MPDDDLSVLWRRQWPACRPVADELKHVYGERWVRFHSLPESKRYPDNDAEYDIVLHRYNVVLDELFSGQAVRIVTTTWSETPEPSARETRWHPDAQYWASFPDDEIYIHLYVSRVEWRVGVIDDLLRAVADDVAVGLMITSLDFGRVHHPYDGGADVLLPTVAERDVLKARHADWLSDHPCGL